MTADPVAITVAVIDGDMPIASATVAVIVGPLGASVPGAQRAERVGCGARRCDQIGQARRREGKHV